MNLSRPRRLRAQRPVLAGLAIATLLAACSGGGYNEPPAPEPVVTARAPQSSGPVQVSPLDDIQSDGNGLVVDFAPAPSRPTSRGFAITARLDLDAAGFKPGEVLRLVLYADFVLDVEKRPLDGEHIGGQLPSGNGRAGGTFRSWFTVPGAQG